MQELGTNNKKKELSRDIRFPTVWYVRPAKTDQPAHTRSLIRAFARRLNIIPLTKHCLGSKQCLELLTLKGGYSGSSESTLVKMPHCWKSRATTHLRLFLTISHVFSQNKYIKPPSMLPGHQFRNECSL